MAQHTDLCGPDSLEVITTADTGQRDTLEVVRWCRTCGAVVVDIDVDGRTQPGGAGTMRYPQMSLTKWKEQNQL